MWHLVEVIVTTVELHQTVRILVLRRCKSLEAATGGIP